MRESRVVCGVDSRCFIKLFVLTGHFAVQDFREKELKREQHLKSKALRSDWLDHIADQENRVRNNMVVPEKTRLRLAELRRMLA